jgi:hypothetical protein
MADPTMCMPLEQCRGLLVELQQLRLRAALEQVVARPVQPGQPAEQSGTEAAPIAPVSRRRLAVAGAVALAAAWGVRHATASAIRTWRPPSGGYRRAGPLTVRTTGSGEAAIVLLHGLPASGDTFGAAFDALARTMTSSSRTSSASGAHRARRRASSRSTRTWTRSTRWRPSCTSNLAVWWSRVTPWVACSPGTGRPGTQPRSTPSSPGAPRTWCTPHLVHPAVPGSWRGTTPAQRQGARPLVDRPARGRQPYAVHPPATTDPVAVRPCLPAGAGSAGPAAHPAHLGVLCTGHDADRARRRRWRESLRTLAQAVVPVVHATGARDVLAPPGVVPELGEDAQALTTAVHPAADHLLPLDHPEWRRAADQDHTERRRPPPRRASPRLTSACTTRHRRGRAGVVPGPEPGVGGPLTRHGCWVNAPSTRLGRRCSLPLANSAPSADRCRARPRGRRPSW